MNTPRFTEDHLFELERAIARRADQLDREYGVDPLHRLEHWRQAERETWSGCGTDARATAGVASQ
jgi:hypothetical protein